MVIDQIVLLTFLVGLIYILPTWIHNTTWIRTQNVISRYDYYSCSYKNSHDSTTISAPTTRIEVVSWICQNLCHWNKIVNIIKSTNWIEKFTSKSANLCWSMNRSDITNLCVIEIKYYSNFDWSTNICRSANCCMNVNSYSVNTCRSKIFTWIANLNWRPCAFNY